MAILQRAVSPNLTKTSVGFSQPITTQSDAISAQQQALNTFVPQSDVEAAALTTQKDLLTNYQTVENQQATVNTAYVTGSSQNLYVPAATSALADADKVAQIKALATDENREKIVNAVRYGVDMWRLQAHFCNIQIMGQTAIGVPGCLQGPSLKPWILQAPGVYNAVGYFRTLVTAVANAVDTNFKQWQDLVTVPGLPWYPMFVAVAAPFAPPMPNIPMPLMVCVSQNFNKLASPTQIETAVKANLSNDFRIAEIDMFIYTVSVYLVNHFISWLSSQNVMMVMGMGPVPTFNPPYVPVGPVVNGYVIPSPGHLAA
ncbi:hypothetical protein [Kaarinaea lacus]